MSDLQVTGNRKFRVEKSQCRGEHMGHYVGHGTAHAAQRTDCAGAPANEAHPGVSTSNYRVATVRVSV